jgi:hypothetical protein
MVHVSSTGETTMKGLITRTILATTLLGTAAAHAQSFSNPIEIDDCTTIEGVTTDTWYVLTEDLLNCFVPIPGYVQGPAIHVKNNTGRVLIDLNGRTLSNNAAPNARLAIGVWIQDSPDAGVYGNYHNRSDSGQWGATITGFQRGVAIERSEGVTVGHSGRANGGIYFEDNNYGVTASSADDVYLNHFAVRDSAVSDVDIHGSDSPIIRGLNVGSPGAYGIRLMQSPYATIWGKSGMASDNIAGIVIGRGSDGARVTQWEANRAVEAPYAAGIVVAAEKVSLDNLTFNRTGSPNGCDIKVVYGVTMPKVGTTTTYQRKDPLVCK